MWGLDGLDVQEVGSFLGVCGLNLGFRGWGLDGLDVQEVGSSLGVCGLNLGFRGWGLGLSKRLGFRVLRSVFKRMKV